MSAESRQQYLKEWYIKNREEVRARQRKYMMQLRKEKREACFKLLGEVCACCGEQEKTFLTIDHVNGGGNIHRRRYGGNDRRLYKEILSDPFAVVKYRTLCWNCNTATRWGRVCPHQLVKEGITCP